MPGTFEVWYESGICPAVTWFDLIQPPISICMANATDAARRLGYVKELLDAKGPPREGDINVTIESDGRVQLFRAETPQDNTLFFVAIVGGAVIVIVVILKYVNDSQIRKLQQEFARGLRVDDTERRSIEQTERERDRAAEKAERDAERAAQEKKETAERAAQKAERDAERAERAAERAAQEKKETAERAAQKAERAAERAAQEKKETAERAGQKAERDAERAERAAERAAQEKKEEAELARKDKVSTALLEIVKSEKLPVDKHVTAVLIAMVKASLQDVEGIEKVDVEQVEDEVD